jgi:hypothetical protein
MTTLSRIFEEAKNHAISVGIDHEIELDVDKFGRGLLFLAGPFRVCRGLHPTRQKWRAR